MKDKFDQIMMDWIIPLLLAGVIAVVIWYITK